MLKKGLDEGSLHNFEEVHFRPGVYTKLNHQISITINTTISSQV